MFYSEITYLFFIWNLVIRLFILELLGSSFYWFSSICLFSKVCRGCVQFLRLMVKRPVLDVEKLNPFLFTHVEELPAVKVSSEYYASFGQTRWTLCCIH